MRLELSDGEMLEVSDHEARAAVRDALGACAPTGGDRCCTQARSPLSLGL